MSILGVWQSLEYVSTNAENTFKIFCKQIKCKDVPVQLTFTCSNSTIEQLLLTLNIFHTFFFPHLIFLLLTLNKQILAGRCFMTVTELKKIIIFGYKHHLLALH